jgi:hypothetical protein
MFSTENKKGVKNYKILRKNERKGLYKRWKMLLKKADCEKSGQKRDTVLKSIFVRNTVGAVYVYRMDYKNLKHIKYSISIYLQTL